MIRGDDNSPRLGFLGVGWIGRCRMQAIVESGAARAALVCDSSDEAAQAALSLAPGARRAGSLDDMLAEGVDGVVIATPSAQHAAQTARALEAGAAVFCQKPLGRNAQEAAFVVEAARRADRLLAVDFSYRFTQAGARMRDLARAGELGDVFALDLAFHNAYGPDKPWFYDPTLSGGGCVMDLGVHLVDLALWTLRDARVSSVASTLYADGARLGADPAIVEDYATAEIAFASGALARLACSWRLNAGRDAVIEATLHGTRGGASLRNVAGSFYDFELELRRGTQAEILCAPPDPWGGRAAVDFARRLGRSRAFDPAAQEIVAVARVIDAIYGRPAASG